MIEKFLKNKLVWIIIAVIVIIFIAPNYVEFGIAGLQNGASDDQINLTTDPSPPRAGKATFVISVNDSQGKPVDNAQVGFDLNMTTMNMGKQAGIATPQGGGRYAVIGNLSMRGPWRVSTNITMPDGSKLSKDFIINAQ